MKRTITIRKVSHVESCNVCGATAYKSDYGDNKIVTHVNEIIIASSGINLCDECYEELIEKMINFKKEGK